jgi:hypothetical protein
VLIAEQQLEEIADSESDMDGPLGEERVKLLAILQVQLTLASNSSWNIEAAALEAGIIAQVDAVVDQSAADFASSVLIGTDEGLDMRVVFGVLALREGKSTVADAALRFAIPEQTDSYAGRFKDFRAFRDGISAILAEATTSSIDVAGVAAYKQIATLFPGYMAAKIDMMEELVPAILKDVAVYTEIFDAVVKATPQATFDELGRLATSTPPQLDDWKSKVRHADDPPTDSLEFLLVIRHRAAADSIQFYNLVHSLLTKELPAGARGAALPGMVKAEPRLIFKSLLSYAADGCFGRCNDIVRLTIRVETVEEVLAVLKILLASSVVLIVRQKNGLDPKKDKTMIGGYRVRCSVGFDRDSCSAQSRMHTYLLIDCGHL